MIINALATAASETSETRDGVYFHHIGKTAGTTFRSFLIARLGSERVAPMVRRMSFSNALSEYGRFAAITGHISAIPGDALPADRVCFTLLRDPVDRALSQIHFESTVHNAGRTTSRFRAGSLEERFADIEDEEILRLNGHVEALWPFGWQEISIPPMAEKIAAAKRALDAFDVVGIQQFLDESAALFAFRMGWQAPEPLPRENVTPGRRAAADLAPATLARVREVLAPDQELYEYGLQRFAAHRYNVLVAAASLRAHGGSVASKANATFDRAAVTPARQSPADESRPVDAAPKEIGTREVVITEVSIDGDISGFSFLQTGERAAIRIAFHAHIPEDDLTVGVAITDDTGALVFGTNSRLVGESLAVTPGDYAMYFKFTNALGHGRYWVTAALHRGASHLEGCFHQLRSAGSFEVIENLAECFEGRFLLRVELLAEARSPGSRIESGPRAIEMGQGVLFLGRRNAPLDDFSVKLQEVAPLLRIARAADAMVPLEVINTGAESWPAFGRQPVRVSYHWKTSDQKTIVHDGLRTEFPRDIAPGESLQMPCFLRAPDSHGEAILVWTLVQEEVAWFDGRNPLSSLAMRVRVTER